MDLLAPGGVASLTSLTRVLSTIAASPLGAPFYRFEHGTSMAAPHVAGVAALLLSADETLTPDEVEAILTSTARPFGDAPGTSGVGGGLVDAAAAVAAARGLAPPSAPVPYVFPPLLAIARDGSPGTMNYTLSLLNVGRGTLTVTDAFVTPGAPWLSAFPSGAGSCVPGQSDFACSVTVSVNAAGLTAGLYDDQRVVVQTNGGTLSVLVVMRVGPPPSVPVGSVTVRLLRIDATSGQLPVAATTATDAARAFRYRLTGVPPGEYLVEAGVDLDGSGLFGDAPEERAGALGGRDAPLVVEVAAGEVLTELDFAVPGGRDIVPVPVELSPDTLGAQ